MEKLVAAALAIFLLAPQGLDEAARAAKAKELTRWDKAVASMAAIHAAGTPELKAVIDRQGGPSALAAGFAAQLGAETKVFEENAVTLNGATLYTRLSAWEKAPAAITVLILDDKGAVAGMSVRPAPPPLPVVDPAVQTRLSLPLARPRQGDWYVFWGGRNVAVNYHVTTPFQRYAYDLFVVRGGRTFEGDAQRNESYFCFGEPILSPAPGRVTSVVDGVADNVPVGAMNATQLAGNHVIIEHSPGEFSMLGHLRNGSTAVKVGDQVQAGTRIGQCGNSGNSSEPHLHYHMQNSGTFSMSAQGLPAAFQSVEVDGRRVQNVVPVRGQRIAP